MSEEILEVTEVEESVDTVVEEVAVKTPAHYHDSESRVHSFDCQETADEVGIEGLTLINGDVHEWIANNPLIVEQTVQEQIYALEASISARRWREAFIGDEEAKAFIKDVNSKIKELRESL